MNTNACTNAIPIDTVSRELRMASGDTGASRNRRSTWFFRHTTNVSAEPNTAPIATAHANRPGVRYWIGSSDESSTCCASTVNRGWTLAACMFALFTTPAAEPLIAPALAWLLAAARTVTGSPSTASYPGTSPSCTAVSAASWLSNSVISTAPVFSNAVITGPSPTTPSSVLFSPPSLNSSPKMTKNISGNRIVQNKVALSRMNPLNAARDNALNECDDDGVSVLAC